MIGYCLDEETGNPTFCSDSISWLDHKFAKDKTVPANFVRIFIVSFSNTCTKEVLSDKGKWEMNNTAYPILWVYHVFSLRKTLIKLFNTEMLYSHKIWHKNNFHAKESYQKLILAILFVSIPNKVRINKNFLVALL